MTYSYLLGNKMRKERKREALRIRIKNKVDSNNKVMKKTLTNKKMNPRKSRVNKSPSLKQAKQNK